ncbi:iron transporter [Singulisphaera sp. PoT]|uniref:iron transporter n=1 Tax=Singulisphaera sp. PoT TaxID=3411797 RepID=UPI003BF57A7F
MLRRWAGPLISAFILGGVILVLVMNLNPSTPTRATEGGDPRDGAPAKAPEDPGEGEKTAGFREYPIGEEVIKNNIKVVAVWLPPVQMEGMADMGGDLIHMEADIHATDGNPNGFAKDEFVPYLKVHYKITPAKGGEPIQQGDMVPMVARDGLHYGASVAMPPKGDYRLTYEIKPPSAGGLGRHSDAATGVAGWWEPFNADFEWDCPGPGAKP